MGSWFWTIPKWPQRSWLNELQISGCWWSDQQFIVSIQRSTGHRCHGEAGNTQTHLECLKLRGTEHEGIISADIPSATDCFIRFPENSTTPHWWTSNLNCQTDQCISLVQTKFTRARGSYRNCFRNAKNNWYLVLSRTHHLQSYYDFGTSLKSIATTHSFRRNHMFFLEPIPP